MKFKKILNVTLIMIGVTFFIACSKNDYEKNKPLEFDGKFPDESATNIEIIISDSGKVSFTLFAPYMNKYGGPNPYMDFPKGIKITSYSNGEKQSVLTADYAISEDYTQRMEASKNVVITDLIKHESIKTEQIIWDKLNKRIYSEVEVTQIKADGTINKGDGFEADEKFSRYAIKNPRGEMLTTNVGF
jgi:LPS export ABC transporter protein LptC